MRYPRFKVTLEMTYDEYLGLLWSLQSLSEGGWANGPWLPDKQTVSKVKAYHKKIKMADKDWRNKNLKLSKGKA